MRLVVHESVPSSKNTSAGLSCSVEIVCELCGCMRGLIHEFVLWRERVVARLSISVEICVCELVCVRDWCMNVCCRQRASLRYLFKL